MMQLSGVTDAAGLRAVLNAARDDAGGDAVLSFTGQDALTFTGVHAASPSSTRATSCSREFQAVQLGA